MRRKLDEDQLRRFRNYPALTFHYGLTYLDILRMPVWLRDIYAEELPSLVAQRQLLAVEASAAPYMEEEDGQAIIDRLKKIVETGHDLVAEETNKPALSQDMYKVHMAAAGIPLTFVEKEVSDA